jgi:hypothetical protein
VRYENLTRLLSEVVTDSGKIDYLRLLERRDTFERVIAEFGECGPDNNAGAFPTEEDELAYWLNAYNASPSARSWTSIQLPRYGRRATASSFSG